MRTLALLLFAAPLFGQLTDAAVNGIVADESGAAVIGASVTIRHKETGVVTRATTNESGVYVLRPLPVGPYALTVEMQGFRRYQREDILLTTGQLLDLPVSLSLGNVAETVTVTGDVPLLETRSAEASQLIEAKSIEEMPMGDRNALNIVEITGGAVFVASETGGSPSFSLGGGRVGSQMHWIDGGAGQNMRIGVPSSNFSPPIEALHEIKVMGNGFSSEFGASAGGVIIANTKSGTNRFRGQLFEYFRNQVLDAPNFFAPVVDGVKQRPALRYNVFGGTFGGPIRRDKTFFFASYQGSIRGDGQVRTMNVPTLAQREGDFSQTFNARGLALIYDPASSATGVPRSPFPGNRIPSSRFDPIGQRVGQFYPTPNRAPDDITGANNFRGNDVNRTTRHNITAKIDHQIRENDKVMFRLLYTGDNQARSSVFSEPAADNVNASYADTWFWYGAWTKILSPTLIHETRFTYGWRSFRTFSRGLDEGWPTKLGFKGVDDTAFPNFAPAGFEALGNQNQDRQQFPIQQYQLVDSISWIRGKHSMRIGGEIRPSMNHEQLRATVSGRFVFSRGYSGLPGNAFTGNGFATMLLGIPTTITFRDTDILDRRTWYVAGYFQDDWSVSRNLTLNLGLRWETDTPVTDTGGAMNGFDPEAINPVSGTPGVVKFIGANGYRKTPYDGDYNNFGPRFGIAWKPFGMERTVLRAGFGVFFAHPFDRAVANAATLGFERSANIVVQDNVVGVPYTMSSGMPVPDLARPPLDDRFGAVPEGRNATQTVTYFETNRRAGYALQPSFRFQHELPSQMMVEWGYIGNLSRKLAGANINMNQIRPEILGPGSSFRIRPFPQFSGVTLIAPSFGVASYHAGLVRLEKRFSRGFNILSTYTWSKTMDNIDSGSAAFGDEGASYSNFYNRRADWGPSTIDIRHRFTLSAVYQLPFGRGKMFWKRGWGSKLAGGWSIGNVFTSQSGGPITVTTLTNTTQAFSSGALRANIIDEPNLPASERTLQRWFNTSAFAQPQQYEFGNQGVGLVRAPGMTNWNLSLTRTFRFGEQRRLQFRAESFNLPNHPNFFPPNQVFEGPGFGIIDTARPGRQVQLGLRLDF